MIIKFVFKSEKCPSMELVVLRIFNWIWSYPSRIQMNENKFIKIKKSFFTKITFEVHLTIFCA